MDRIEINREVLLVEIDRHCFFADCNARVLVAITKKDALDYHGFECHHCSRWSDDRLAMNEIPDEWWAEFESGKP